MIVVEFFGSARTAAPFIFGHNSRVRFDSQELDPFDLSCDTAETAA